jgi:putative redox protein
VAREEIAMSVIVKSVGDLRQEVSAGGHRVVADEPFEAGGTGRGLNPYELLLGALGACTAMTVLMYARRKGWPVEGVVVELDHTRAHVRDCEKCEQEDARLDVIRKRVMVRGPLDDEQRVRLEEISRRCPVQRTLTGTIRIDDELRVETTGA